MSTQHSRPKTVAQRKHRIKKRRKIREHLAAKKVEAAKPAPAQS